MKFSVIIPTFNRAQLVLNTVRSALDNEGKGFEVIVVDDGSTDETESLLQTIHDPRLRYVKKDNGERASARNFGAAQARGEYLNFFDSDDRMLPSHLIEAEKCVQSLGHPEVFALGYRVENSRGKLSRTVQRLPDPMNLEFIRGNPLGCNPVFVRRDIFADLPFKEDRDLAGSEDILLWLQLAARYPFRFWPSVTSVLLDHDSRSVYGYSEAALEARNETLLRYLETDPVFMNCYGPHLNQIRAQRHIYTAVHLAVAGFHFLPLKHLAIAARLKLRSLFQAGTAGTLKRVFLGFFRSNRSG
ncbi:MAG: glycosyltransferase family 2 protein [Bdellovibrionota bacterium]